MLDPRLEDGSRVAAMFPPCAVDGILSFEITCSLGVWS